MKERKILYADEGMVLTDGETYGTTIYLADDESGESYREIPKAEYDAIMAEQEALNEIEG